MIFLTFFPYADAVPCVKERLALTSLPKVLAECYNNAMVLTGNAVGGLSFPAICGSVTESRWPTYPALSGFLCLVQCCLQDAILIIWPDTIHSIGA